jgi:SNF2 family DNA or RNA helicase
VLDEAQFLKNPQSKAAQVARALHSEHRLCLTGTPVENHLDDLWSLFAIALPGLLGDRATFGRIVRTPIEKRGDLERRRAPAERARPFLLRRTKENVASELSEKTEIVRRVELSGKQRDLYETVRIAMHERVQQEIERSGIARSHIVILDALLKLRQVCCDPRLLPERFARSVSSIKLDLLVEIVPEMIEEGRRILLFSQFTSMLDLIVPELEKLAIPYAMLTGKTTDRAAQVQRFESGDVPLFLISLKAGGTGLNLTSADTVIHYDPWWNPAVERQATDRAHRIGQTKRVFVYKLIGAETVEEKILDLQTRKAQLAAAIFSEKADTSATFAREDIERLFSPLS